MKSNFDSISPITGNLCVIEETDDANNIHYVCMESGYTTTSYLTKDSEAVEDYESRITEQMRVARVVSEQGLVWYPAFLQTPVVMLYCSGTDADDLIWEVAQVVPIPEEEREQYPIPGYEDMYFGSRLDTEAAAKFAKNEFSKALDLFYSIFNAEYATA